MKLKVILVMFTISAIVRGFIWAAAVEPVVQILGLGSIFTASFLEKKPKNFEEMIKELFANSGYEPTKVSPE